MDSFDKFSVMLVQRETYKQFSLFPGLKDLIEHVKEFLCPKLRFEVQLVIDIGHKILFVNFLNSIESLSYTKLLVTINSRYIC